MRTLIYARQFHRDQKRLKKRGYDPQKLQTFLTLLITETPIPSSYRPHPLHGKWNHHHEAHIAPDWLIIYRITPLTIYLLRTGTHTDLFPS